MDLFAQMAEGEMREVPLGFRLQRLEVYNWGTFDKDIWTLELAGDTSLLTGDVGSGKSTLVDAVLTLLVPPRKVTYNKAADASARERSLTSYVRGYYGQSRTEDGGGRPEALRGKESYSVILGVFADRNLDAAVTLAQVFYFPDEQASSPKRFYALARRTLSIGRDFSQIGGDMRAFRKRLERSKVQTFDDYPRYGHEFRKIFGLRQSQALELFQQTVSMKKVDSLTEFVRANMLELPDAEAEVEQLLRQYHDLDAAHQAVQRAREQEKELMPIEAEGQAYELARSESVRTAKMQELAGAWFARADYRVRESAKAEGEAQLARLGAEAARQDKAMLEVQEELRRTQQAKNQSGGQQLAAVEQQLKGKRQELADCQSARQNFAEHAGRVGLKLPEREENLADILHKLQEMQKSGEAELETLTEDAASYQSSVKEAEQQARSLQQEIDSLAQRRSNIPYKFTQLRGQLCEALGLDEQELPFAGELMAVREEEAAWEGALERLLHGFGISLLVPEAHYGEVAEWMEKTHLGVKMVYFCASSNPVRAADFSGLPEEAACRKLLLREDSPLSVWLAGELSARFRHICCESLKEFRREKYALTQGGQLKSGGQRHEKDDRYELSDRRHYVLGFDNLRKMQVLKDELEGCQEEQRFFQQALRKNKSRQKEIGAQQQEIAILGEYRDFARLDAARLEAEIASLQRCQRELMAASDKYRELARQEQELLGRLNAMQTEQEERKRKLTQIEMRLESHRDIMGQDEELIKESEAKAAAAGQEAASVYAWLDEAAPQALSAGRYVFEEGSIRQQNEYTGWLRRRAESASASLQEAGSRLAQQMTLFCTHWPELAQQRSLTERAQDWHEYRDLLQQLREDDLPSFEGRFYELLKENTINQIALFHTHLESSCQEIEERIGMINESLAQIDYNEGRYIQIECHEAPSELVRQFRANLRACTDDALTGAGDDSYNESKFRQVSELVSRLQGRPGETEADAKWRALVTDVRNWYSFAASERWRDRDEEYEHYTDSGGKSGGQKEKLAYTILAASIVYNFGLEGKRAGEQSFRFVVIDEAFLKSSDDSARFGLELFKKLDLQLLVVTPLLKLATIEPFVRHVGFVYLKDEEHRSYLRNLSIEEVKSGRAAQR